ncbi:AraC family transcriptional regulator [Gordonia spumicola]|uniref:AraC family transcriptional regulator n=1 Tax=Gordonia spumicola TaxID=589161 RepID=A0A7I9VDR9_9ACTN|nr:AraC family transcriptional regulator [Gordonia spumicola]GEE03160.1 AraC family transcriptional regulator [Gordonia spumicola]
MVREFARNDSMEARRSCQDNACYRPHTHDRFSVGLIDDGTSTFRGAAGRTVVLEPGDVIVIPADQVHTCNQVDASWTYQMLHAEGAWIESLTGRDDSIEHGVRVFRDDGLYRAFDDVIDRLFGSAPVDDAMRRALTICAGLEPWYSEAAQPDPELLVRLEPVLDRLRDDPSNPRLEDVAALVGMDRDQLIRAVKRATGMTPIAWRHNRRVITAREMLRGGHSVIDTAHALGYADQSHFHRVFRAHVAATPGGYRR